MNEIDFCRWLQGFFELSGEKLVALDEKQTKLVREHLALVFTKVTDAPAARAPEIPGLDVRPRHSPFCSDGRLC